MAAANKQPFTLHCNGIPFDIKHFKDVNPSGLNLMLVDEVRWRPSDHALDRHNETQKAVLNNNFVELTEEQWVDLVKEEGIYTLVYEDKRPSDESRDIVRGILLFYSSLDWIKAHYYHGLGHLSNHGLEWVDSNFGSDWDERVHVHHVGYLHPDVGRTHQKCKGNILKAIDSIFLGPKTEDYPPFFEHWHQKMVEWAKSEGYEDPLKLIDHVCWLPWNSRLDLFETLYHHYIGFGAEDLKVQDAINEAIREYTDDSEKWVDVLPKDTPFETIFDEHKIRLKGKPNLFLYARAAGGHMHDLVDENDPQNSVRRVKSYKYIHIGGEVEDLCKKRMFVEKRITDMFPYFLDTIAYKLQSK